VTLASTSAFHAQPGNDHDGARCQWIGEYLAEQRRQSCLQRLKCGELGRGCREESSAPARTHDPLVEEHAQFLRAAPLQQVERADPGQLLHQLDRGGGVRRRPGDDVRLDAERVSSRRARHTDPNAQRIASCISGARRRNASAPFVRLERRGPCLGDDHVGLEGRHARQHVLEGRHVIGLRADGRRQARVHEVH